MKNRKIWNKKDGVLIVFVLAFALGLWIGFPFLFAQNEEQAPYAIIHYGEHIIEHVPLGEDQTFSLPEHPTVVFEVRGGSVAFVQSDCPDQICVHTGFIDAPWHFAACLPNRLMLSIENTQNDGVDSVVR